MQVEKFHFEFGKECLISFHNENRLLDLFFPRFQIYPLVFIADIQCCDM